MTNSRNYKLAIAVCSRSGTLYMTRFLNMLSVHVGHEHIRKDGIVGWMVPLNYYTRTFQFNHVFHQVRNPMDMIASHLGWGSKTFWRVLTMVTGYNFNDNRLLMAGHYWLYWNSLCEEMSDWRYKIEDFYDGSDVAYEFFKRLDLPYPTPWPNASSAKHASIHEDIGLADFDPWPDLQEELAERAQLYGYSTNDLNQA